VVPGDSAVEEDGEGVNHIDLFSGIGGFALAAREVWGEDYNNLFFCDNNNFCQQVLRKNFGKERLIYDDIRLVSREQFIADTDNGRQAKQELETTRNKQCDRGIIADAESGQPRQSPEQKRREDTGGSRCDILTGGFPCQPFSQAGKRRGTSDDRFLWPQMLRVIRDFKPTWVLAENVRGLLTIEGGVVFNEVCLDLEREGYDTQAFVIPAVAVGAPHRRDRVWIVAHNTADSRRRCSEATKDEKGYAERPIEDRELARGLEGPHSNAPDTELQRPIQHEQQERPRLQKRIFKSDTEWSKNWLEVALETCSRNVRMDDGVSERIHGLTPAGHRVERLKALGNAIVPQVAVEIFKAIKG